MRSFTLRRDSVLSFLCLLVLALGACGDAPSYGGGEDAACGEGCPAGQVCADGACIEDSQGDPFNNANDDSPPLANPQRAPVAIGELHTCALSQEGEVWCWGVNSNGQIGGGGREPRSTPARVEGLSGVVQVAAGGANTCALDDRGVVSCMGLVVASDEHPPGTPNPEPVPTPGLEGVVMVTVGFGHSCALQADGRVACWGWGYAGQLGTGDTPALNDCCYEPVFAQGIEDAVAIAAGHDHTCAVHEDGGVSCWGNTGLREGMTPTPRRVAGLQEIVSIDASGARTCALDGDGESWCWGGNSSAFGGGVRPARVEGMGGASAIGVSNAHLCAIREAGQVWCVGDDPGHLEARLVSPTRIEGLEGVAHLAAGPNHTCAWRPDGEVSCWGRNHQGQLGVAPRYTQVAPHRVEGAEDIVAVTNGRAHTCGLSRSGEVSCWGDNACGQLGERGDSRPAPQRIEGLEEVVMVDAEWAQTCALEASGRVACWGAVIDARIDHEGLMRCFRFTPEPTYVPGIEDAVWLATGTDHACVVHETGAVSCWGRGGHYGPGGLEVADLPRPVEGIEGAVAIVIGAETEPTNCALLGDGGVRCWGGMVFVAEFDEDFADFDPGELMTPEGISAPSALSLGVSHGCAIEDGRLVCWGDNFDGQLGTRAVSEESITPVFVEGPQEATSVAVGGGARDPDFLAHSCAVSRGEVWCWGSATHGQAGPPPDPQAPDAKLPARVAGLDGVVSLDAAATHTCAVHEDGGVSCWGANHFGQLALEPHMLGRTPEAVAGIGGATPQTP